MKTTPLLLASLGLIISSRAQFISIGSEGQIYLGAMGAAAVGLFAGDLPPVIAIPACMIAAVVISALWGGLAGWLKVRINANEVIVTLMMNYVAIELVRYFVNGPWRDPNSVEPFTAQIMAGAWLPKLIPRTRLHIGILIALAMTILFWWLIHHTTFGYRLTICGASPEAAVANGINSKRMVILSMLISGFVAFLVAYQADSLWLGVLSAIFVGGFMSLIFAFMTITLQSDQTVSGLSLNFLGQGLALYLYRLIFKVTLVTPRVETFPNEMHIRFHRTLMELTENDLLLSVWNDLSLQFWVAMRTSQLSGIAKGQAMGFADAHGAVVDAIVSGDMERIRAVIREHVS